MVTSDDSENLLRKYKYKTDVNVMNPNPPICISNISTICPKTVSWDETSIEDKPVTQVALVARKSASMYFIFLPSCCTLYDIGKMNKRLPTNITRSIPNTRCLDVVNN